MPNRPSQNTLLRWYQVPVVWLGVLIFVASLVGCVWIIAASVQYGDEPLTPAAHAVLGVPTHAQPAPASS